MGEHSNHYEVYTTMKINVYQCEYYPFYFVSKDSGRPIEVTREELDEYILTLAKLNSLFKSWKVKLDKAYLDE